MTLIELIAAFRRRVSDTVSPYLWSDDDCEDYANDAEQQACRRSRLLVDSTTTEITELAFAISDVSQPLDERVLFIKRAKIVGQSIPLSRVSFKDMDGNYPGWEDQTADTPTYYIPDMDDSRFRPYPTPSAACTVKLTVVRLPLTDMALSTPDSRPEINKRYHVGLLDWMMYRAYSRQDSETKDGIKANECLVLFESQFGKESTAMEETWINREHGYTAEEGVYQ